MWIGADSEQVFEHQSIAELALVAGYKAQGEAEQGVLSGEMHLTPIQIRFFENTPQTKNHNQSVTLVTNGELDEGALHAAVNAIVKHHDVLRSRFKPIGEEWRAEIVAEEAGEVVRVEDYRSLRDRELEEEVRRKVDELHGSLSISEGPVVRAMVMKLSGKTRVVIAIHHLAVDGRVGGLIEDLEKGYEQASKGEAIPTGLKTTSYQRWG